MLTPDRAFESITRRGYAALEVAKREGLSKITIKIEKVQDLQDLQDLVSYFSVFFHMHQFLSIQKKLEKMQDLQDLFP